MKTSIAVLAGICLLISAQGAFARAAPPPPAPPPAPAPVANAGQEAAFCTDTPAYQGLRAGGAMLATAFSAKLHTVSACDAGMVSVHYHDQSLHNSIGGNPALLQYLSNHEIDLDDVLGAQNRRGQLILFVQPN